MRGDPEQQLALGKNILDDARAAHLLGVHGQDDDALGGILDGQPAVLLDILPLEVLEQIDRLGPLRRISFVRHAEELRKRRAERLQRQLEFGKQGVLDVDALAPRRARRQLQLLRRDDGIQHQVVVLRLDRLHLLLPMGERDGHGLAKPAQSFLGHRRKRRVGLVVDDLHHAVQLAGAGIDDGARQNLLGAIAGALVHLAHEAQAGIDGLELLFIMGIADIHACSAHRHIAGDALLGHRQAQILERA